MADLVKNAETALAGEQAPYLAGPALTQNSSETHIDRLASHDDDKLSRVPTADVEKDGETGTSAEEDTGILTGFRLYAVFLSLMLACFLFALDQSVSLIRMLVSLMPESRRCRREKEWPWHIFKPARLSPSSLIYLTHHHSCFLN